MVSVGNLRVGGTGKTPLTATLARWLLEHGERPSILSRGYGRTDPRDGVTIVSDGQQLVSELASAGDEPLMLAKQVPGAAVLVAADRADAGRMAERIFGCSVHLLDDGFQHLRLHRDCDVLAGVPGDAAGGKVLPAGRLREPPSSAADANVFVGIDATSAEAEAEAAQLGIASWCAARRVLDAAVSDVVGSTGATAEPGPVIALAAVASPAQFFAAATRAGWNVVDTVSFPDHHVFGSRDLAKIVAMLRRVQATAVVTTEKDAPRLEAAGPLPFAVRALPMRLEFDGWERLERTILASLDRARASAAAEGEQTWPPTRPHRG